LETDAAWYKGSSPLQLSPWQTQTGLGNTGSETTVPSTPTVIVRRNQYESGRALIVILNEKDDGVTVRQSGPVTVTLPAGTLGVGQAYSIRNVQNIWGPAVASGNYNGTSVSVPMDGGTPPPLIGRMWTTEPPTTGPFFNAFVLTSP
jgi:hypothetical protein